MTMKIMYRFLFICVAIAACLATQPAAKAADEMSAFKTGNRILFQGDSITDGGRWRTEDPNHILGQDYAYIIAAKYGAMYPERQLTFINRGVSGNTVSKLASRWQTDTIDLKPDILSILVGVNDSEPVSEYEKTYEKLLADTVAALPNVRLVLCDSFTWPSNVGEVQKARTKVVERLAAKYHAPVVYFQKAFNEACKRAPEKYWIWDGVHPTYSGHQIIVDEWVRTVQSFYK